MLIGIDVGTQAVKIAILSNDGSEIAKWKYFLNGLKIRGENCRQETTEWEKCLVDVFEKIDREFSHHLENRNSLGICTNCSTLIAVDKDDTVIEKARLWCDKSHLNTLRLINQKFAGQYEFDEGDLIPRIAATVFRQSKTAQVYELNTWILKFLTGQTVISDHIFQNRWGETVINAEMASFLKSIGADKVFKKTVNIPKYKMNRIIGKIENFKINSINKKFADIKVLTGGNDGIFSAIGAGLLERNKSTMFELCGTSHLLITRNEDLPIDENVVEIKVNGIKEKIKLVLFTKNDHFNVNEDELQAVRRLCRNLELYKYPFVVIGGDARNRSITKLDLDTMFREVEYLDEYCGAIGVARLAFGKQKIH